MTAHKLHADEPAPRRPPHNLEAEQALLGAVLIKNAAYEVVSDFLRPTDFHDPLHQRVYELVSKQVVDGRPVDVVTIRHEIENLEPVNKMTVPQYLGWLVGRATTTVNAREYGRTIRELSDRRQLITIGEDIANAAFDGPMDFPVAEQITEAEARLYSLAQSDKYGQGFEDFGDVSAAVMEMAVNAHKSGGASGLSTGFVSINNKLGGFQPTDLIVVAGRPSMGKTSLATNVAFNVARRDEVVAFFSLEMSSKQLVTRILSEQARVPSEKIRRGLISQAELQRLADAQAKLASIPLKIDQTGAISIAQLAARARRLKRQQKRLDLVIIDYLQLMTGSRRNRGNRVEEVSEITTGLKALAKELEAPVLALSQLNRGVDNREDKRPHLADLRESGSIEQDADIVMFVYREEYYLERMKPNPETEQLKYQDWLSKMQKASGLAEVIIGKQRHGPIGIVALQFDGSVTRFSDLAYSVQSSGTGK
jgi:replicative DNA helicase